MADIVYGGLRKHNEENTTRRRNARLIRSIIALFDALLFPFLEMCPFDALSCFVVIVYIADLWV